MDPDNAPLDPSAPGPSAGRALDRRGIDNRPKVTEEIRREIVRRAEAGEKRAALAAEFGVTRQAVELMIKKARELAKSGGWGRNLSDEEQQRLKDDLLRSRPFDHGLSAHGSGFSSFWTPLRAYARAEQLFGRKLKKLALMEMFRQWNLPKPVCPLPSPEEMTEDLDESHLEPEMLADEEFMAYIRSPLAREIRRREIALWRREHEKRKAGWPEEKRKRGRPPLARTTAPTEEEDDFDLEKLLRDPLPGLPAPPVFRPGLRVGKHKSSKGNPFIQKKKRRKR